MTSSDKIPLRTDAELADGERAETSHTKNGRGVQGACSSDHTPEIKCIPHQRSVRQRIREAAACTAAGFDPTRLFTTLELQETARKLLTELKQSEKYLGYTMVLLGSAFWRQRFVATPFNRRLLLLPEDVQHTQSCPPEFGWCDSPQGECAACAFADYRETAEQLGYKVLMTSSATTVLTTVLEGQIEGIIGIANLDELEKALEKVLVVRVPSYAVPLEQHAEGMWLDDDSVRDVLEVHEPEGGGDDGGAFVSLVQAANQLFADDLERLLPRGRYRSGQSVRSPLEFTEAVAYDWLAHGGKRFRPFITLAAYDALTSDRTNQGANTESTTNRFPDAVCRVAIAIEVFHKASLVHDDIQDDDQFRYGRKTLHRSHGVGPAINIGDYLIGLGYRLVNACRDDLGADVAVDIVQSMSDAHIKLCDGQGAEMAWQSAPDWSMPLADALEIYALKTSPAFEAALFAGLRMAGPVDAYATMIPEFARHLGVGFQVLNDLKDWQGDADNKLIAGQDALAIRPTALLSLALERATDLQREELREIYESTGEDAQRLSRLRELFNELDVFRRAEAIVDDARDRASGLAVNVDSQPLRRLLSFLVDTVLAPVVDEQSSRERIIPVVESMTSVS
ncbi:MAG: polyprenyl synthetase family protein [Planctomycetaceae bacterium]|nr:polyprenyl synthetase family protein [Planctomycetaceae bacterium]